MNKRRWGALLLAALTTALLCACGGKSGADESRQEDGSSSEEPAVSALAPVEEDPVFPYASPLTGEGLEEDISGQRPFAVMLNNLSKALPQLGVARADVIYEIVAEGGITRMMAVFQDLEGVGELGAVRSARDYYVNLALGHDSIYIHAGGSPQAYDAFDAWGIPHIDFVNGPYGSMCWRDPDRRATAGLEHSLLTSSELILEQLPERISREHDAGFSVGWTFDREAPAGGEQAERITVPFSSYKTGYFTYDSEADRYLIEQHINGADVPYVDGSTDEAVAVSSVLVLFTDVSRIPGDDAGRMDVRTTGSGAGLLFRSGRAYEITWQRGSRNECYAFLDASGQTIPLAVGPSYINVVGSTAEVVWE